MPSRSRALARWAATEARRIQPAEDLTTGGPDREHASTLRELLVAMGRAQHGPTADSSGEE